MLKISKGNEDSNYLARIVKIKNLSPVEKTDNLATVMIDGNTILTNKHGVNIGDYVVYFPAESQVSSWYLHQNNLYSDTSKNSNKEIKGFFGPNGRVRCMRLRGYISAGFIAPVKSLGVDADFSKLEDVSFDTINNKKIVSKYEIITHYPNPFSGKPKTNKKFEKLIENQFRFHINTPHFMRNLNNFYINTEIQITRKLHGTSGISSYVLCNERVTRSQKFCAWVNNKILSKLCTLFGGREVINVPVERSYKYVFSSRSVLKDECESGGFYKSNVWKHADAVIRPYLVKGMTMYYEIVGYLPNGKMIQKDYSYGMVHPKNGEYKYGKHFNVYVYRITSTNKDGNVIEFSSEMVQQYCDACGLNAVPEYFKGTCKKFLFSKQVSPLGKPGEYEHNSDFSQHFSNKLSAIYLNHVANDCKNNVPDEGIVIRVNKLGLDVYKLKSPEFLLKETEQLDSGEPNIEE